MRNDDNLSRERQSLYFRFLHRVSKSKKLPYKLLRIFCTGFTGVSVSETLHYLAFLYTRHGGTADL